MMISSRNKVVFGFLVYTTMLVMAYLASSATLHMQQHAQNVSTLVQKALRLTAVHILESTESVQLHKRADYDAYKAQVLEEASEQLQSRSEWEHTAALESRQRGEFYLKLALLEQARADIHWNHVQRDQELHDTIMANLTLEREEYNETLLELEKIHTGPCNRTFLSALCNAIGNVASLQQRADAEALQIHKEWHDAEMTNKDEVVEQRVAELLQGRATEFNATAQKLMAAATAWDERAQHDFVMAQQDEVASASLKNVATQLENQAEREEEWNRKSNDMVQQVLLEAEQDHVAANRYALQGILWAVVVLVFLVPRAMHKVIVLCTIIGRQQGDDDYAPAGQVFDWDALGRNVSYIIQHVIIFLLTIGIVGDKYLVSLEYYGVHQRAVILVWFACVGASMQVLLLHGIRVVYVETTNIIPNSSTSSSSNSTRRRDWTNVCWQLAKRFPVTMALFLMEVLFCWLAMGHSLLLQASVVTFLSSCAFRLCALALMTWHIVCMDLQWTERQGFRNDEESTLYFGGSTTSSYFVNGRGGRRNNNDATEATPLRKEDILSVGTPIDIYRTSTTTASAPAAVATAPPSQASERTNVSSNNSNDGTSQDGSSSITTLTPNSTLFVEGNNSNNSTATTTAVSTVTATPLPRHYYSLQQGLSSLLLPLEIFVITCMVTIVSCDMHVVWHSQARVGQCLALACVVLLLILVSVMLHRWTAASQDDDDDNDAASILDVRPLLDSSSSNHHADNGGYVTIKTAQYSILQQKLGHCELVAV